MKKLLGSFPIAVSVALFAVAPKTWAQYEPPNPYQYDYQIRTETPFYFRVDLGGNIMQDMKVRNVGSTISFNPGLRADFMFGYQINPVFALEFETGTIRNELSSVNGLPPGAMGQRADLNQMPFLGNLVYQLPFREGLWGYIGVGAGGVSSELDLSEPDSFNTVRASDTDFTFAYQGKIGVNYTLGQNMEIGIGYKFLGTLSHSWFAGNPFLFTNTDPAYSHSVVAAFTWRF